MFDLIKNALTRDFSKGAVEQSGWGRRRDATQLAVCVLLLELAHAEESATDRDRAWVRNFIEKAAGLPAETGQEVVTLAEQVRARAIEMWQFTRLIAQNFSLEEKLKLVEAMWRIIYVDGQLNMPEDYLIHKFSTLLGLRHSELIEAKLRVLGEQNSHLHRRGARDTET